MTATDPPIVGSILSVAREKLLRTILSGVIGCVGMACTLFALRIAAGDALTPLANSLFGDPVTPFDVLVVQLTISAAVGLGITVLVLRYAFADR